MERQLELVNRGPIERLVIPIPEQGGVVVLKGLNGKGKTTALETVQSALDGKGALQVKDGESTGHLKGMGCEVRFGRRTSRAGELQVAHLEGLDPFQLVDPGPADPAAADRRRISILCGLAKVKPDPAPFQEIFQGVGCELSVPECDDLPDMAAKAKRILDGHALSLERAAAEKAGAATGMSSPSPGVPGALEPTDPEEDARAVEEAIRRAAEAEGQADGARKAIQAAEMARAALESAKAGYSGPSVADATTALEQAMGVEENLTEELRRQQERVRAARAELKAAQEFESAVSGWEKAVSAGTGIRQVDEFSLADLRTAVSEAKRRQSENILARDAIRRNAEARQIARDADALSLKARDAREAAKRCEGLVAEAIAKVAPRGLTIEDGRIYFPSGREGGRTAYHDLSFGERTRLAVDIAVDAVGPEGLIVVAQESFEGLDPVNRSELQKHALERKAVILTAEADAGELRAEVMS